MIILRDIIGVIVFFLYLKYERKRKKRRIMINERVSVI
jgi:hypothetical protein